MNSLQKFGLVVALLCAAFASTDVLAQERPVALSEARRMLDRGETREQVIQVMADRGVSFAMSADVQRRLTSWEFTEQQIAMIGRIVAGEAVDPGSEPDAPDVEGGDGPEADADAFEVGYTYPAREHAAERQRVERAVQAAGLGYERIELTRCTIYCNAQRARTLAPMLRDLERAIIARFPASIANASSPQSSHIVIVDGQTQWRNWIQASFDAYEQDGITYSFGPGGENPREQFSQFASYFLSDLTAAHADRMASDESIARYVAYSLGHLMMGKAGGFEQPDGLQTGFGDYVEAMAFDTPSIMVYSYDERDLDQNDDWRSVVAQRFEAGSITSPTTPWGYETDSMEPPHYAECWSLVATLCEAPEQFAEAVGMVRDGESTMGAAVSQVYRLDDRRLLMAWNRYVTR